MGEVLNSCATPNASERNSKNQSDATVDVSVFVGRWVFERVIDNHRDRVRLSASGTAEITVIDELSLKWTESGVLSDTENDISIRRQLTIRATHNDPMSWWVVFPDGRPFHRFVANRNVQHECGEDVYVGLLTSSTMTSNSASAVSTDVMEARHEWKLVWNATGPRKNFTSTTTYRRSAK